MTRKIKLALISWSFIKSRRFLIS